ncbi:amidohydrolase family protein [Streptomyces sp. NBC_00401]|uniref:amidohydrolase family protein n=1 Tax=unclassified Streptomyces TaxID=2593676 RepID=UPI002256EBBA|nr:amidohydrolase family protein [Streptomyces sp. NBC_00401]MCX5084617.1 amidohydrolase family protein [Streptomyces sp. NBC_00401]
MLALRIARVFDGRAVVEGAGVVFVDGGRIVGVEPSWFGIPTGVEVLDRPSGTLLPGLVDAHVHLVGDGAPGALERPGALSQDDLFSTIERSLRIQLAAGVTTVRDLGDVAWSVVDWRARRPRPDLPTVVASGPPLTSRAGYCRHMDGGASGSDELRAAVRERAERGADVVKIMAGGGMPSTPGSAVDQGRFTAEELALVVRRAHAVGLPVTAHAHALVSIRDAIAAGVDGIEHCTFLASDSVHVPEEAIAALAAQGIVVCPTLGHAPGAGPAPQLKERMYEAGPDHDALRRRVVRAHLAGVTIVSGTDGGIGPDTPHGGLPRAVMDLVSGGMAAADALASATSVAARACGLGDRKGRVRTGYDADLVVVDGDPFTDMAALARLDVTVLGGQVLSSRS